MAEVKYLKNVADAGYGERNSIRVEISTDPKDLAFLHQGFEGVAGKPITEFFDSKITGYVLQQFYVGEEDIGPDEAFEDFYYTLFTENGDVHWLTLTGSAPPNAWLDHKLIA